MNKFFWGIFALIFIQPAIAAKSLLQAQPQVFPTTVADTSFTVRTENATQGYQPFANRSAYQTIQTESEEAYLNRMIQREELQSQRDAQTMSREQYCDKYPLDDKLCPQTPGLEESIIAIGNRKPQQQVAPQQQKPQQQQAIPQQQVAPQQQKPQQQQAIPQQQVAPQQQKPQQQPMVPQQQTPSTAPQPQTSSTYTKNNISFNGPCTPPQRSKIFVNKILTSGQYAQSDPAFEKAMITVFRTEGECSNDPDDAGGYTCYGISQKNNPEVDVRNITRADAERIGYNKYYTKYNMNTLPDNLRGNVFMLGWASGPATAVKKFCKFLKIPERTKIDENIVLAATSYPGDIHNDFLDDQQNWYIQVSKKGNNKKFLKGWMNRVQLMRENGCHTPTTEPITR